MKILFLKGLLSLGILCYPIFAQNIINGLVLTTDEKPIQDANIYFRGYLIGTTSDEDGYFTLSIPDSLKKKNNLFVVFNHISHDSLVIPIVEAYKKKKYILVLKTFSGEQIVIQGRTELITGKELPVSVTVIDAKMIENKGFVDAGDLLRTDQSIQVNENLDGKKTISIRGGNPENVLVLYNGVRMNNNYDNVFDLSLISLEDIQRIEIIKGSNTSLYGSEALSGVINFVPKLKQDHTFRFIQKFGSYNSGDWSMHFNHNFLDNLFVSYKHRRSGSQRKYDTKDKFLQNETVNHTLDMNYNFSDQKKDSSEKLLSFFYMKGDLIYKNNFLLETADGLNQLASLNYTGSLGPFSKLRISTSYQNLDNNESIRINSSVLNRKIENQKTTFLIRKTFEFNSIDFTTSYQFDNIDLDYFDNRQQSSNDTLKAESLKFLAFYLLIQEKKKQ